MSAVGLAAGLADRDTGGTVEEARPGEEADELARGVDDCSDGALDGGCCSSHLTHTPLCRVSWGVGAVFLLVFERCFVVRTAQEQRDYALKCHNCQDSLSLTVVL